jgi:CubicO group peptidase (beta-lactamase class C family)
MQPEERADKLEATILKAMQNAVPGLTIFVVKSDGVRWARAFGLADIATHSPASQHTVYMWFSMTKLVTATCVLQLAEHCQIDLDDPVVHYYAPFKLLRPFKWMESVTLRNLLNHTSGLSNPIPITWIHRPDQAAPDPDAFLSNLLARRLKLRFEPGSTASYSNVNYLILGQIIASVAKEPYQDYVRRNVLMPLRMSHTDFVFGGEISHLAATAYQKRWSWMTPLFRLALPGWVFGNRANGFVALNRFYLNGAAYGGLIGSAEDAAVFLRAHLNGGAVGGQRILSPESIALMQTITAHGPGLAVGLGWFGRSDVGSTDSFLEHLGGGGGYFNVMRLYPRSSVGIVMMGNSTSYDHNAILGVIADRWCRDANPDGP